MKRPFGLQLLTVGPSRGEGAPHADLDVSFCIITNGKRPAALRALVSSIARQNIPVFEIVITGDWRIEDDIVYVPCREAAVGGYLGRMRNLAVGKAKFNHVVHLDDDFLLAPDWYRALRAHREPFDILTSQIRLPDGGRYWDHATIGGPRGHAILAEGEDDEFVYMTGGGAWVMRSDLAKSVEWDESRAFYQGEDVDFSRRCQRLGARISHHHEMIAFHDDATYTNVGRRVLRRAEGRTHTWARSAFSGFSSSAVLREVDALRNAGNEAEAADLLRLARVRHFWSLKTKRKWSNFVEGCGGPLPGARWFPQGDPLYLETRRRLSGLG
jgi:hypothetical protein